MEKLNCWQVKKCGREAANNPSGVCPVAHDARLHGVHSGKNAGRCCWVVAGTLCGGQTQGTFANKYHNCEKCDFYKLVRNEEGPRFELSIMLLKRLREQTASGNPR